VQKLIDRFKYDFFTSIATVNTMEGVRLSKPNIAVFDKAHLPGMRRALRNCGFLLEEKKPVNGREVSIVKQWEGVVSVVNGDKVFCETRIWESLRDGRVSFSSSVSMGREGHMLVDALRQREVFFMPTSEEIGVLRCKIDWQQGVAGAILREPEEYVKEMIKVARRVGVVIAEFKGDEALVKANDAIEADRLIRAPAEHNVHHAEVNTLKEKLEGLHRESKELLQSHEGLRGVIGLIAAK